MAPAAAKRSVLAEMGAALDPLTPERAPEAPVLLDELSLSVPAAAPPTLATPESESLVAVDEAADDVDEAEAEALAEDLWEEEDDTAFEEEEGLCDELEETISTFSEVLVVFGASVVVVFFSVDVVCVVVVLWVVVVAFCVDVVDESLSSSPPIHHQVAVKTP